jgi:hypothetical protein
LASRAEDRKYHFTYKVTCTSNLKVFYGLHSANELSESFRGTGSALSISEREQGIDNHLFERLQLFATRNEAKIAYNELKASQLANPRKPGEYAFHYLYKITRFDGKFYIGVHSTNNLKTDKYLGSGTYISRSVRKYGKEKHVKEIIEFLPTREAAFLREGELVTEDLLRDSLCMNQVIGGRHHGDRVYGVTEETRAKLSEHFKTIPRTAEWKAKIAASHVGKKMPREAVEKQRAALTGRKSSPEDIAKRIAGQLSSEKFKKRYRPIIVDGVAYANGREATAALGLPGNTLQYRLASPNWLNYQWADQLPKDPALVSQRARGSYECK